MLIAHCSFPMIEACAFSDANFGMCIICRHRQLAVVPETQTRNAGSSNSPLPRPTCTHLRTSSADYLRATCPGLAVCAGSDNTGRRSPSTAVSSIRLRLDMACHIPIVHEARAPLRPPPWYTVQESRATCTARACVTSLAGWLVCVGLASLCDGRRAVSVRIRSHEL